MSRVLVVDDDVSFLGLMVLALRMNYIVDTAKSFSEALAMVDTAKYDALILDVSLPDYTGYYLAEKIRKNHPDIPIAFLTNYDGDVTKENADLVDAVFWYKPDVASNPVTLAQHVHNLIHHGEEN